MKLRTLLSSILLWLGVTAGSSFAATTVYTDRAAFDLATGAGLSFEGFSDASFDGFTLTPANAGGGVTNGQFIDRPTPGNNGVSTTFVFDSPITAFGANYDLSPGGSGNGLRFVLDGNEIVAQEISAPFDGFFGFVSDTSFSSLIVEAGSGPGRAETHFFDGLSFGIAAPVAPVPVPASLPMLLLALAAAFGWRRWQIRAGYPA